MFSASNWVIRQLNYSLLVQEVWTLRSSDRRMTESKLILLLGRSLVSRITWEWRFSRDVVIVRSCHTFFGYCGRLDIGYFLVSVACIHFSFILEFASLFSVRKSIEESRVDGGRWAVVLALDDIQETFKLHPRLFLFLRNYSGLFQGPSDRRSACCLGWTSRSPSTLTILAYLRLQIMILPPFCS